MLHQRTWQPRSSERLPDSLWNQTVHRVRSEFEEMPCMRLTTDQARALFGLPGAAADWVLRKLVADGFLWRTPAGEYMRRGVTP